jgi:hypothetical protein
MAQVKKVNVAVTYFTLITIRGKCFKAFCRSSLLPFQGNTIILCYKAILPWQLLWNCCKLPQYLCNQCYKSRPLKTEV